jgi:hypothetical protein
VTRCSPSGLSGGAHLFVLALVRYQQPRAPCLLAHSRKQSAVLAGLNFPSTRPLGSPLSPLLRLASSRPRCPVQNLYVRRVEQGKDTGKFPPLRLRLPAPHEFLKMKKMASSLPFYTLIEKLWCNALGARGCFSSAFRCAGMRLRYHTKAYPLTTAAAAMPASPVPPRLLHSAIQIPMELIRSLLDNHKTMRWCLGIDVDKWLTTTLTLR